MEDPRLVQTTIYGEGQGPPMLHQEPHSKPPARRNSRPRPVKRRNVSSSPPMPVSPHPSAEELLKRLQARARELEADANLLSPGSLPGDFPPELAFRALAAYALLRTLSVTLRLSPFTPNVFLRSLYLPYPNKVMGQVHVALLRILLPSLHLGYHFKANGRAMHKRRTVDNIRWPLRGGDNLTYLDGFSWPVFYDDYCHLTADRLYKSYNDRESHLDFRLVGMQIPFDDLENPTNKSEQELISQSSSEDNIGTMAAAAAANRNSLQSLLQQQQQQLATQRLGRGQRAGKNQGYTGMVDPSDSDSEYGDNNQANDVDGSSDEKEYRRSRNVRGRRGRPRKNPKRKASSPVHQPSRSSPRPKRSPELLSSPWSGTKVMDVAVPLRPSLDPSTETKYETTQGRCLKQDEGDLAITRNIFDSSIQCDFQPNLVPSITNSDKKTSPPLIKLERSTGSTENTEEHGPSYRRHPKEPSTNQTHSVFAQPRSKLKLPLSSYNQTVNDYRNNAQATQVAAPEKMIDVNQQLMNWQMAGALKSQQRQMQAEMIAARMAATSQVPAEQNSMFVDTLHSYTAAIRQQHQQHLCRQMAILRNMASAGAAPRGEQPRRQGLEVDDDVVKALRSFMCGVELEPVDVPCEKERAAGTKASDDFQQRMYDQQWIHFQPLKKMKAGVPYHRLSPEDKVIILEFLIDQLLSLDEISAEFSRRKAVVDCYPGLYGTWPTNNELENLENNDECGVCGGEGELLCCDGCVSSFHRACIDMSSDQQLPKGKWLCPECGLVDPALLGPLRGGAKESLDWFSVDDIHEIVGIENERQNSCCLSDNIQFQSQAPSQMPVAMELDPLFPPQDGSISILLANEALATSAEGASREYGAKSLALPNKTTFNASMLKGKNFLVVHGFAFSRPEDEAGSSAQLLSNDAVRQTLDQIDPAIRNAWPLAQIPSDEHSSAVHFPNVRQYLGHPDAFDPNFYNSKYRGEPSPICLKAAGGIQIPKLMYMDFETECTRSNTYRLTQAFTRDFTHDALISKSLQGEAFLFDPYHLFKGYMSRLAGLLRKACLLSEFWEAGTEKTKYEVWLGKVRKAGSITRLARLLLQLVDSAHPRAFEDGWSHNPSIKGDEVLSEAGRQFEDLPPDWTTKQESRKRAWEKTPHESMLRVCEKEGFPLHFFVQGINEHVSRPLLISRSKRKQTKYTAPDTDGDVLFLSDDPGSHNNTVTKEGPRKGASVQALENADVALEKEAMSDCEDPAKCVSLLTRNNIDHRNGTKENSKSGSTRGNKAKVENPPTDGVTVPAETSESPQSIGTNGLVAVPISFLKQVDDDMNGRSLAPGCSTETLTNAEDPTVHSPGNRLPSLPTSASKALTITTAFAVERTASLPSKPSPSLQISSATNTLTTTLTTTLAKGPTVDSPDNHVVTLADASTDANTESGHLNRMDTPRKIRRLDSPASTTRRTRRSAGRYAVVATEKDIPGESTATPELSANIALSALGSIETHIDVIKLRRVPQLEKIVKVGFQKQLEWPVCGRILFATTGNLPPREMKRLGRNGGVVKAPYVAYQTSHEVGQVCYSHIWRKETEQCCNFEEFILQVRVLESFLDRSTIQSSENVVRRGKAQIQKIVKVTKRDPSNGIVEHFVVNKGKGKGCWVSSEHLDVSALILEAFGRKQKQINKRSLHLQQKEKAERDLKEKEMATYAAEQRARQIEYQEARARSQIAKAMETKAKEANVKQAKAKEAKAKEAKAKEAKGKEAKGKESKAKKAKAKQAKEKETKAKGAKDKAQIHPEQQVARVAINQAQSHPAFVQGDLSSTASLQPFDHQFSRWTQCSNDILTQHQMDVTALIQKCFLSGVYPVPESNLVAIRTTSLTRLKHALANSMNMNFSQISDDHLAQLVSSSETDAIKKLSFSEPANSQTSLNLTESGQVNRPSREQHVPHRLDMRMVYSETRDRGQEQHNTNAAVMTSFDVMDGYPAQQSYPSQFDSRANHFDSIFDSTDAASELQGVGQRIHQASRPPQSLVGPHSRTMGQRAGLPVVNPFPAGYPTSRQNGYIDATNSTQESFEVRPTERPGMRSSFHDKSMEQSRHHPSSQQRYLQHQQLSQMDQQFYGFQPSAPRQPHVNLSSQAHSQQSLQQGLQQQHYLQPGQQQQHVQSLHSHLEQLQRLQQQQQQQQQLQQQNSGHQAPQPGNYFW